MKTGKEVEGSGEFRNMLDLLEVYSEASNRLMEMQAESNSHLMELLDEVKGDYARHQEAQANSEAALEVIAKSHPEWFKEKKSVKTAFGTVKLTSVTKIVAGNEEASIILLEHAAAKNPELAGCVRMRKELDLEALDRLGDDELRAFRIKRVTEESFSVKAVAVDLGKASSAAAQNKGA